MSDCTVPMRPLAKQKTIYIIGPVSGIDYGNKPAFEALRETLESELPFYRVEIPHDTIDPDAEWEKAMRQSISRMMQADCVVLAPDWNNSRGANIEFLLCHDVGIPVFSHHDAVIEIGRLPR